LPHEVVVEHVLPLDCGELLFDELAHVGQILRGVNWRCYPISGKYTIYTSSVKDVCKGTDVYDFLPSIQA
jgi:hypothetical protein